MYTSVKVGIMFWGIGKLDKPPKQKIAWTDDQLLPNAGSNVVDSRII
jgi:hypothetical protein